MSPRFAILVVACIACVLSRPAYAQAQARTKTVEYKRVGGAGLLLDVCSPDAILNDGLRQLRPVVIVVHGGGWGSGDRKTKLEPVLAALRDAGYVYVSVDYRLSPRHPWPACREDVQDAVGWTKTHVQHYSGDPDRIAILGYSAGGQLAFWAAIRDQPPHALKALVGLAPATDFLEDLGRRGGPSQALRDLMGIEAGDTTGDTLARLYDASPINHLHQGMPPMLLIHGAEDRSVPLQQSVHIQQKIAESKWSVPCELYKIDGAPHRLSEWSDHDRQYLQKLLGWLAEHL